MAFAFARIGRTCGIGIVLFIAQQALAATEIVKCPIWDSTYADPETAGYARMRLYASAACIGSVSCVIPPAPGGHGVGAKCTAANPCGSGTHTVYPNGYGIYPSILASIPYSGATWCGLVTDDQKNKGDPNPCPDCGQGRGNPVNVATGNKFQREPDFAGTAQGTLRFVRVYNSAPPWMPSRIGSIPRRDC